jgi:repressor LexA
MRQKSPELMERIRDFIESCYFDSGRSPSTTEIGDAVGIARGTAYKYLVAMEERGLISYEDGSAKTERMRALTSEVNPAASVSGFVPCGTPQTIEASVEEYIPLPVSIFGSGELFIVRASHDSMIEAGIDDGDLVVVRKQQTARDGDIVVALVNNENTLKRYYRDDEHHRIILHPENRDMDDIIVRGECYIQGVAQQVIKNL